MIDIFPRLSVTLCHQIARLIAVIFSLSFINILIVQFDVCIYYIWKRLTWFLRLFVIQTIVANMILWQIFLKSFNNYERVWTIDILSIGVMRTMFLTFKRIFVISWGRFLANFMTAITIHVTKYTIIWIEPRLCNWSKMSINFSPPKDSNIFTLI